MIVVCQTSFLRVLCVPAVLVIIFVSLAFAPSALAAETGQITGKVTDASTQAPVANVMVCMWPYAGTYRGEEYVGADQCEETGANGEYTLSRVPAGTYGVMFFVSELGIRTEDYALQYYGGGSSRSEGREVVVRAGETTGEVDAAMQPGGHIKGVVTDASTQAPIEGVEACTGGLGGGPNERPPSLMVRCGVTGANGEYTIPALSTGEYLVEYHVPTEDSLDYARQFYSGQTFAPQGNLVPVTTGETTTGIDVAMQPGGNISGRVTAAATAAALDGIEVCAVWVVGGEKEECWDTNANGEYLLSRLPAGEYAVEFGAPLGEDRGYELEYYGGKTALSEAGHLVVTPGVTLSAIDASLHALGEVVQSPPPIEARTETTPTLSTNSVSPTPLVKMAPLVTIATSQLVVSHGTAQVRVACSGAACQGSIELVARVAMGDSGGGSSGGDKLARSGTGIRDRTGKTAGKRPGNEARERGAHVRTLVLATGSFSLAGGHSGSVLLHLTPAGRRRLAHASRRHPVAVKLTLVMRGGKATTGSVLAV